MEVTQGNVTGRKEIVGDSRRPLTRQGFAEATGYTIRQVNKAVQLGDIRTVLFAGNLWIPASEADRVNAEKGSLQAAE